MKPIAPLALLSLFAVTACVPRPRPAPPPSATPVPAPRPAVNPPAPAANWLDQPQTEGTWVYRSEGPSTMALFGGEASEADFIIRCDRSQRRVLLMRAFEQPGPNVIRIRTETAERVLPARSNGDPLPYLTATLSPDDRLLDAMALSKGRFAVQVAGATTLYLPSWAEVTRVVEDCR